MPKLYRSREGPVTAVSTKSQLTTLGSETAPGPLLVPSSAKKISKVIVYGASNNAAANDAGMIIRLEGPGLPEGTEVMTIGSSGGAVATGQQHAGGSFIIETDLPVTVANEILVFAEMTGEDVGALNVGVTLVFDK